MSTPILGIDLGTTNSVVAYTDDAGVTQVITDENGDRIVPSVIHFQSGGDVVVGRHAKQNASVEPDRVAKVFKRGMGTPVFQDGADPFAVDGKTWTPEALSAIVLTKLAGMAEQHFGEPARRAVITVPYYFGEPERAATRSAGGIAGLDVLQIVNEPTAAAIAHGIDQGAADGVLLVFDLGGGTFDVTVMRYTADGSMDVIASAGDRELGGADFDEAIAKRIGDVVERESGLDVKDDPYLLADTYALAEELKKELSTSQTATKRLPVAGKPIMFTLTRAEFEGLIADRVELVEDAVLNALDKAELDGSDVDTVLMVGGSSRIPLFQEMIRRITGRDPQLTKNLDEDVARGAAMLGAKLGGDLDPRSQLAQRPQPKDAASHALGLTLVRGQPQEQYNQVVIPEGTPIPHKGTHMLAAASEGQTELELVLNEGRDEDLDFVRELGKSTGRFSRPVRLGHPLRCELEYTADQLVEVHVYDGETSEHVCELRVQHSGMLSPEEKEDARSFLAKAEVR
ncbi:MAG TPA: Hsp70 family protein [Solirubrobacteraceae bacterium]